MRKSYVTIYDVDMRKVAHLENAANIGYELPMNSLWRASFDLPIDDPKNEYCKPFYFVEIFDQDERIELFRILPSTIQRSTQIQRVRYQCEHVLATLIDDVMFQYHQIGNIGVYTRQVLQYILSRQSNSRWVLGDVQFNHQFEYNWENTNLLGALFSVPKPFVDEYMWTFDTTVLPWRLNLIRPSNQEQARIRYGRNMIGITKDEDPTNLVNRIYALGYGEGVNQLTFAEINNGRPYIEDTASINKYGLKATVWVDRRFESAETLKARAEALLDELKEPRISYTVQASELYAITKDPIDKFRTGTMVRVQDPDIGETIIRVVNVKKRNAIGMPGDVQLEIANRPQDIAGTIAELQSRMRIEEVYAQGATIIDTRDFADNCDPQHPAIMRFFIPEETARINKVMLSYQSEAFRAYSRAIESAPATTSGPSSRETTASGGQTTSGPSTRTTTATGGTPTSGPSTRTTTADGGATVNTRGNEQIWEIGRLPDGIGVTDFQGQHNHTVVIDGIPYTTSMEYGHQHSTVPHYHTINLPSHHHDMDHIHTIMPHVHDMDHTHQIGPHTHGMDHTHQIPSHTHDIEHGIFNGPTPTGVTVKVDGRVVPGLGASVTDVDIIPYLSKDGGGKIERGTWHTIEITPNNLGRIVANVISQIFVQSRGGGDY